MGRKEQFSALYWLKFLLVSCLLGIIAWSGYSVQYYKLDVRCGSIRMGVCNFMECICVYYLCHTFYSPISLLCGVITFMNTEFPCGRDITGSWNCCEYVVSVIFARSGGLYGLTLTAQRASPNYISRPSACVAVIWETPGTIWFRRRVLRINRRNSHGT